MGRQVSNPSVTTVAGTVNTFTSVGGKVPATPSITSPANNSNLPSFTPTLASSAFFVYTGDTHAGSNWQVASDPNFTIILKDYATTAAGERTALTLGAADLPREQGPVYFRVRYISSASEISPFGPVTTLNRTRTLTVNPSVSGSNYTFTPVYAGTGSPTSFTITIANNEAMTSPIVAATSIGNGGAVTAAITSMPGYALGTSTYYIRIVPAGADSINTSVVQPLAAPAAAFSATGQSAFQIDTSQTVNWSYTLVGGTGPTKGVQFSTTQAFTTVAHTATSSPVNYSSLPGIATGTPYFIRYGIQLGNDFIVLTGVSALKVIGLITPYLGSAASGTYTVPSHLAGLTTIHYIGQGGMGPTNMNGGSGGGGSGDIRVYEASLAAGSTIQWTMGAHQTREFRSDGQRPATQGQATTLTVNGVAQTSAAGGQGGYATNDFNGADQGIGGSGGAFGRSVNQTGSGGNTFANGLHNSYGAEGTGAYYNGAGGPGYKHDFGIKDNIRSAPWDFIAGDNGPKWDGQNSAAQGNPLLGGEGGKGFGGGGGGGDHYSYNSYNARGAAGAVVIWFGGYTPF